MLPTKAGAIIQQALCMRLFEDRLDRKRLFGNRIDRVTRRWFRGMTSSGQVAIKRLKQGCFIWPKGIGENEKFALAPEALALLLDGVDLKQGSLKPWYQRRFLNVPILMPPFSSRFWYNMPHGLQSGTFQSATGRTSGFPFTD